MATRKHINKLKITAVILAAVLSATSCSSDESDAKNKEIDDIILTSGLQKVDSCDALLENIKKEASDRVGPYGFERDQLVQFGDELFAADAVEESVDFASDAVSEQSNRNSATTTSDSSQKSSQSESSSDPEFSGTNNQELDVDEADIVKTDGERILVVQNQKLYIVDASSKSITDTVELPEWQYQGELFIQGDTALLMSQGNNFEYEEELSDAASTRPAYQFQTTHFSQINLNSGNVTNKYELPGSYLSAREVNGTIRVVVSSSEQNISFVYPSDNSQRAIDAAEEANKALIETSEIEDWIPYNRDGDPVVDCKNVYLPNKFAGFGLINVVTLDMEDDLDVIDSVAVFTDAQDIYASTDRLVVSTPEWSEPGIISRTLNEDAEAKYKTALHTFDISNPESTNYVASGRVPGTLLNRYSISEHDGYIRVATTEGSPSNRQNESESMITVLEEEDNVLLEVGQVDDIGRGETIFAVRFQGDIGYVVTFRQTDPFYTVDLSNPENPEVLGELKIPGFSSYLHPVDENTILAVGTDGDENGATGYPVASVFDVSDLNNPEMVDKIRLSENQNAYSLVDNDPRAFQFWNSVALIPVDSRESENGGSNDLVVVELEDGELTELGRISHPSKQICEGDGGPLPVEPLEFPVSEEEIADLERRGDVAVEEIFPEDDYRERGRYCFTDQPGIVRSLVIDGELFSVSRNGIRVNDFDSLDEVDWISFK